MVIKKAIAELSAELKYMGQPAESHDSAGFASNGLRIALLATSFFWVPIWFAWTALGYGVNVTDRLLQTALRLADKMID